MDETFASNPRRGIRYREITHLAHLAHRNARTPTSAAKSRRRETARFHYERHLAFAPVAVTRFKSNRPVKGTIITLKLKIQSIRAASSPEFFSHGDVSPPTRVSRHVYRRFIEIRRDCIITICCARNRKKRETKRASAGVTLFKRARAD